MKQKKIVYVAMSADIIHPGHINILRIARECARRIDAEVVLGLLTDDAITSYKRVPYMDFEQRRSVVESLKYVDRVIAQDTLSYEQNIRLLRPRYVIHGDDWKNGVQQQTRQNVVDVLTELGCGELLEPVYTPNISSTLLNHKVRENLVETDNFTEYKPSSLPQEIKHFNYFNPVKIHYEMPYLEALESVLSRHSEVLLVSTRGILKRFPEITYEIKKHNVQIVSEINPNPELVFLQGVKKTLRKGQCILAIGGGSVMDSAKFLSVDGEIKVCDGRLEIAADSKFLPIYAIPTTAGTSSELTQWATIWDTLNSVKYSLSHEKLYPQEAFYDSHLMLTLSRNETINGALDTLSHCLESIWNKNRNPISFVYASKGIDLVLETLPCLVEKLDSLEYRRKITLSNIYAGLAFSNTQTALAHALSYPFTMRLGLPHGIACSITLPILMENIDRNIEMEIVLAYKEKVIKLFEKIGISIKLRDYGINEELIEEIFGNLNSRAKNGLFDLKKVKKAFFEHLN